MADEQTASIVSANTMEKKRNVRKEVWDQMELQDALLQYRPHYIRAPFFKGFEECVDKLMSVDEMREAKCVFCDIDRSLVPSVRCLLQKQKTVLIPEQRSQIGFLRKLPAPVDVEKDVDEKSAQTFSTTTTTTVGSLFKDSSVVSINMIPHIDVLILSSVVVSSNGSRMGEERPMSRMLYPLLYELGAVDEKTLVVTLVHDLQVTDLLTEDMSLHLAADLIITPHQVIHPVLTNKQPRMTKLDWSAVTDRTISGRRWMRFMREHENDQVTEPGTSKYKDFFISDQSESRAAEQTTDKHQHQRKGRRNTFRRSPKKSINEGDVREKNSEAMEHSGDVRQTRVSNDMKQKTKPAAVKGSGDAGNGRAQEQRDKKKKRRNSKRRYMNDDQCVYVGGLKRNLIFSEVKQMIQESEVNPQRIFHRRYNNYAFLYFKDEADVTGALEALERLKIEDERIRIEKGRRATRSKMTKTTDGETKTTSEIGETKAMSETENSTSDETMQKEKVKSGDNTDVKASWDDQLSPPVPITAEQQQTSNDTSVSADQVQIKVEEVAAS